MKGQSKHTHINTNTTRWHINKFLNNRTILMRGKEIGYCRIQYIEMIRFLALFLKVICQEVPKFYLDTFQPTFVKKERADLQ